MSPLRSPTSATTTTRPWREPRRGPVPRPGAAAPASGRLGLVGGGLLHRPLELELELELVVVELHLQLHPYLGSHRQADRVGPELELGVAIAPVQRVGDRTE